MAVYLEITDRRGPHEHTVDGESFWLGTTDTCDVVVDVPGFQGRLVEVRCDEHGLAIRCANGVPFPVRCVTGSIGSRFENVVDGDVVNVGPALVRLKRVASGGDAGEELDLDDVASAAPGAPVGSWYHTFMEVADHFEGLSDPLDMVVTAMRAVLSSTAADRVHVLLEQSVGEPPRDRFFLTGDDETPFGVSSSLIDRARDGDRVVHVPVASADPIASQFVSVRSERISSSIAFPLRGLGRKLGVFYADCVRDGAVLTAEDLHRVVFIGRLLASALGNRDLVTTLVRAEPSKDAAEHPALQTASPAFQTTVERVKLYAPTDYTVLIRGETGAGKEVVARAIHDLSRRKDGPFVPVNCAAIPEQLMESVLFGHEKGAFTGATESRAGHFEEAHGGTIFLDEIGDMALDLQAKILRVLQDRVVSPVGSRRQVKVDVRILAATHQDLEKMVAERRFREDLYYRLRELEVGLPPLRQRIEDILLLCNRFLGEAARELGFDAVPDLATETLDHLQRRGWRGNIRELRHVIKAAALRAGGGPIRIGHLDTPELGGAGGDPVAAGGGGVGGLAEFAADGGEPMTWKQRLEAQEKAALRQTLEKSGGNLTRAAQLFGVPRTTYREKLVKNGLLDELTKSSTEPDSAS